MTWYNTGDCGLYHFYISELKLPEPYRVIIKHKPPPIFRFFKTERKPLLNSVFKHQNVHYAQLGTINHILRPSRLRKKAQSTPLLFLSIFNSFSRK